MTQEQSEARWREIEREYGDSPLHRLLGLTLRVVRAGDVTVLYAGSPSGGNRSGKTAGGILATLVDSAAVQACKTMLQAGSGVATIELKVNFVRPAPASARLTASGHVDHLGRSVAVSQARVEDAEGALIALGLVTVSVRRGPAGGER